ncbi:MAG: hypothetical protein ACRD4S_04850 [Candidatus Acidiferrales bacterium]
MSSGFNTDVRVAERVFHVQTEDRGPTHLVIDTAVYQAGRVVHRRSTNYGDFAASRDFSSDALKQRVADQHRAVIEALRDRALETDATATPDGRIAAIEVQLLNPGSWLSGGKVSLDVAIVRRPNGEPAAEAEVAAWIEGALQEEKHADKSDEEGRVKIQFPLPPLGKGDLALVIQARAAAGSDEIRFTMRSRVTNTPAPITQ